MHETNMPSRTIFCTEKKRVGRVSKLLRTRGLAVKEKKGPVNEAGRKTHSVNFMNLLNV